MFSAGFTLFHYYSRLTVYFDAEISKRHTGAQRITVKRRSIQSLSPMSLRGGKPFSFTLIQNSMIERTRLKGPVKFVHRRSHGVNRKV